MTLSPTKLMEAYLTEVVAEGRVARIADLAHPDMVDEANQQFGGPPGRDGLVAHAVGFRRAVGGVQVMIDRIVAGPDQVMAQWSFAGTHDGRWLGRPATGEPISGTVFSFFTLRDGKISRYALWLHAMLDAPVTFDSSRPFAPNARAGDDAAPPPAAT